MPANVNVSAIGTSLRIVASNTFPSGFTVTQFVDDADPLDIPNSNVAEATMNINGDLVIKSSPSPITININVLPTTEDDDNLQALLDANRPAKGRSFAKDVITMIVTYAGGKRISYTGGAILTGNVGDAVASASRIKSKMYAFAFQDKN